MAKIEETREEIWQHREELRALMREMMRAKGVDFPRLARRAKCSEGLCRMMVEDVGSCTHPNIAARILGALGITARSQLKWMTAKCRWHRLPRIIPYRGHDIRTPSIAAAPPPPQMSAKGRPLNDLDWEYIRTLCKARGVTQEQVASALHKRRGYIYAGQFMKHRPEPEVITEMARELMVDENTLYKGGRVS